MKPIFTFLLSFQLVSLSAFCADVHLLWDASPTPDVTYRLFATTNALTATNLHSISQVIVNTGTNCAVTVSDITPGLWTFAATAVKQTLATNPAPLLIGQPSITTNTVESAPSNFLPLEVPEAPKIMRIIVMQADFTLTGSNWIDAGFFKLGIK